MTQTADPAPKAKAPALAMLFLIVFINLVGFGLVVPLLPFFAQSLNAEPWQITVMFAAYSLGQFFAEPFWGRLSDRIGRKPVLLITLVSNAAGYLALAFVPNIWMAVAVRLFTGLGHDWPFLVGAALTVPAAIIAVNAGRALRRQPAASVPAE